MAYTEFESGKVPPCELKSVQNFIAVSGITKSRYRRQSGKASKSLTVCEHEIAL